MNFKLLDSRVKLFMLICLSSTALIVREANLLIALLIYAFALLFAGGVKPVSMWLKLRSLFGLVLILFVLQCGFNRGGEPILTISGFIIVTASGFNTALIVCLRLLIIILSALIVAIGDTRDYLLALTQLKVPYEIAFMVLAALRFLPMLRDEARDVFSAAQMRGMKLKKNSLSKQAAMYLSIVIPVVAGAIHRAEELSIAMEARGFRAFPQRTSMRRLQMHATDWLCAIGYCIIQTVIIVVSLLFA